MILFIAQFPLYQLVHEVVVRTNPGPDRLDVLPGGVEITVVVDEVGQDHGDGPAGPGHTVNKNPTPDLSLPPDDSRQLCQVWEYVLRVRVLQGQLDAVFHQRVARELLGHVDDEAGLEARQSRSSECSGWAEEQVWSDLGDLKINKLELNTI